MRGFNTHAVLPLSPPKNLQQNPKQGALNVCLWAVTACMLALSLLSAFGRRRRDDVLGFAAGLMFALPTVRGLLPAVPGGEGM
jgi:hypothetical protein